MSALPVLSEGSSAPGHPNAVIAEYLAKHIPEYKELVELRREGWNNPAADAHFAPEYKKADKPTDKANTKFFEMTCRICFELNTTASDALTIPPSSHPPTILDLCLAPGGFSSTALWLNPTATLHGITPPAALGGFDVRIPGWRENPRIAAIHFLDITMLTSEMDPPSPSLPPTPTRNDQKFDLVFCGGTVLRNHTRAEYRQGGREGTRLLTSQLVLAMGRIWEGGTLVVVLHRADAWGTVRVVRAVSRFCGRVELVKPRTAHERKGSFYLVARGVRPGEAGEAVEGWRRLWRSATFGRGVGEEGGDGDGVGEGEEGDEDEGGDSVEMVLAEFGEELVRLTAPVFKIQAEALRTAPYAKK